MNVFILFYNEDEEQESSEFLVFSTIDKCNLYMAENKIEDAVIVSTKVDSHEN